ncbi:hypothetical protein C5167_001328 [Papaver somniferum]|uniref:RING-type domain-containing protein n=1 Tax=Papaver somniferum TaxID=3469 RepID=A0A4Y7KYY0_PAPSO|nr:hypothetical protein C5167_001328 [Papaver somniferum]
MVIPNRPVSAFRGVMGKHTRFLDFSEEDGNSAVHGVRRHTIFVHTSETDENSAFHEDEEDYWPQILDDEEEYPSREDEDYPSREDEERPVPGLEYEGERERSPETPLLQQPMLFTNEYEEEELETRTEVEPQDGNNSNLVRGESNVNDEDIDCCSICMDPYSSHGRHKISCLPCGHLYGLSCIRRWIKHSRRRQRYSTCPMCDRKCSKKDVIELYVPRLPVVEGGQQESCVSFDEQLAEIKEDSQKKIEELNNKINPKSKLQKRTLDTLHDCPRKILEQKRVMEAKDRRIKELTMSKKRRRLDYR